jgi:hypothetical protein
MLCNEFPPHGNSSHRKADLSILELPATPLGKILTQIMESKKNGEKLLERSARFVLLRVNKGDFHEETNVR